MKLYLIPLAMVAATALLTGFDKLVGVNVCPPPYMFAYMMWGGAITLWMYRWWEGA